MKDVVSRYDTVDQPTYGCLSGCSPLFTGTGRYSTCIGIRDDDNLKPANLVMVAAAKQSKASALTIDHYSHYTIATWAN